MKHMVSLYKWTYFKVLQCSDSQQWCSIMVFNDSGKRTEKTTTKRLRESNTKTKSSWTKTMDDLPTVENWNEDY